jgi:hypothetical protein
MPMGMFDISEETAAEYREKFRAMAAERVDEPVLAVGPFRHAGAASSYAISKAQLGAVVYAANALRRKKKAGGLPGKLFLVVTPTKLHAFTYKQKGRDFVLKDEAAVWDRVGIEISTKPEAGLTMLTIAAPAGSESVTLAPGGVKDDPWTREVIGVLTDGGS